MIPIKQCFETESRSTLVSKTMWQIENERRNPSIRIKYATERIFIKERCDILLNCCDTHLLGRTLNN